MARKEEEGKKREERKEKKRRSGPALRVKLRLPLKRARKMMGSRAGPPRTRRNMPKPYKMFYS